VQPVKERKVEARMAKHKPGSGVIDPELLARMEAIDWKWPKSDMRTVEERMLDYSKLVSGWELQIPAINEGKPFQIDVKNWRDIDRALLGSFLGFISMRSYKKHGFLFSAIVVGKTEAQPSPHFFQYVRDLGILEDSSEDGILTFWGREFRAVFRHYAKLGRF
jgi:hypothetical protein